MRRRILLLVVGMTTLVVLAFAIPLTVLIRSAVQQRAERALGDQADALALLIRSNNVSSTYLKSYLSNLEQTKSRCTSVTLPDGTVLGTQPPASAGNLPSPPPQSDHNSGSPGGDDNGERPGGGGPGRATTQRAGNGRVAQVAVDTAQGAYLIRVYASSSSLRSGETEWWLLLAGGSVGLLLMGVVGGEIVTRRLVRPLVHTAQTANRMSTGDVTARAPTDGPREVADVGSALNRLGDRIDQLIAEERETVADMSHRLRTPLTALRLDAESLRDAEDAERIGAHVSALERTLTAIIRAARRPQREGRMPSADATAVVTDRVTFWSALADDQGRHRRVSLPDQPLLVRASAEDLAVAVDALLENVIAHTPEGTPFTVRLAATSDGALLEVGDEGPGLPTDAGVRGRSDRGSSGLGLDIARQCADVSGGSLQFGRSPSGGALISMYLGRP